MAARREVVIIFSAVSFFPAPTAWDRRMDTPFEAPMAMELRIRMTGVAFVRAA